MSTVDAPQDVAVSTVVTPAPHDEWAQLHAADPRALVSQHPAWTGAAVESEGHVDASRLYRFEDGSRAVLPLLRSRGVHRSLPDGLGIGGLVGDGDSAAHVAAALDDVRALGALSVRIRPDPSRAEPWRAARPATATAVARRAHVLDLRPGPEALWDDLHKNTRRSLRKAEKADLEICRDTTGDLLDEFEHLYSLSVERWASQQSEPLLLARWRNRGRSATDVLRARARAVPGGFRLWVARLDGQPIAAVIVLVGNAAHYTKGAMDRDLAGPVRASHLLQWTAIQDAAAEGCATYHMGDTGSSASLARFKESFGAAPVDYEEVRIERLPLTAADRRARAAVKRVVGFRDG